MQLTLIIMNLQIGWALGRLHAFLPHMKGHFQGLAGTPAKPFFNLHTHRNRIVIAMQTRWISRLLPASTHTRPTEWSRAAIGVSLGGPTGYAINPARDLGPRIAHAILPIPGKGSSHWEYAWVPIVGPILGALIAAFAHQALQLS